MEGVAQGRRGHKQGSDCLIIGHVQLCYRANSLLKQQYLFVRVHISALKFQSDPHLSLGAIALSW
jgi:hypothetical protein